MRYHIMNTLNNNLRHHIARYYITLKQIWYITPLVTSHQFATYHIRHFKKISLRSATPHIFAILFSKITSILCIFTLYNIILYQKSTHRILIIIPNQVVPHCNFLHYNEILRYNYLLYKTSN